MRSRSSRRHSTRSGVSRMAETQSFAEMVAVRDVAGKYITELGSMSDKVVVVNADLMGTSRNVGFKEKYPDRAFNVGIAEQDLVSFAAGLAHEGFMPYAFTMASFLSMRACEQCRTDVAYGNLFESILDKQSAMQQAANQMGRQLVRGLLGSLLGGSKRK